MKKKLLLALCVFVVLDFGTAQLAKWLVDGWRVETENERLRRVRVRIDPYHHGLAPGVDESILWGAHRYRVCTNSLGFRDSSVREVPLKSEHYRVLLIGDSFTEGVGAKYEDSYAGIITAELAGRGIEVLNAGVVSYSPAIYFRKIAHLIDYVGLEFDEVVVFLDISDIQDEALIYRFDTEGNVELDLDTSPPWIRAMFRTTPQRLTRGHRMVRFGRNNSIFLHLVGVVGDRMVAGRPPSGEGPSGPDIETPRSLWTVDESVFDEYGRDGLAEARRNMSRLAALLAGRRIPLTVAVYPWPAQVAYGDLDSLQVSYWKSWAAENGAGFIDLFPPFFSLDRDRALETLFFPGDLHYTDAGHRLAADEFLSAFHPAATGGL